MADPSNKSLKRAWDLYYPVMLTLLDAGTVSAGLGVAYWIRFDLIPKFRIQLPYTAGHLLSDYARLYPVALACFLAAFMFMGLYRPRSKVWSGEIVRRLARGSGLALVFLVAFLFFARGYTVNPVSRWIIPISLFTTPILVLFGRHTLSRQLLRLARREGRGMARALVIGVGYSARQLARAIRRHPELGYQVAGFVSTDAEDIGREQVGLRVLGTVDELAGLLDQETVEAVFVAQPDFRESGLGQVFMECQKRMVEVKVAPDLADLLFSQVDIEDVDGIPLLGLRGTPLVGWNIVVKRFFDIVLACVLLTLFLPLTILIAILVKLDSDGPVFYRQVRVGADGAKFLLTKFRTMRRDAEKECGPVFSTPNDPRQTRVGRVLRQTHLDELPQLLNVLLGHMSMVGPRPERPVFVEHFRHEIPWYMARHRIKSGITGWAQVKGQVGDEGSIPERLKFDLYYIENWSLFFDVKIVVLTLVWLSRRVRQLVTLPPDHPSLRKTRGIVSIEEMDLSVDQCGRDRTEEEAEPSNPKTPIVVPGKDVKAH